MNEEKDTTFGSRYREVREIMRVRREIGIPPYDE